MTRLRNQFLTDASINLMDIGWSCREPHVGNLRWHRFCLSSFIIHSISMYYGKYCRERAGALFGLFGLWHVLSGLALAPILIISSVLSRTVIGRSVDHSKEYSVLNFGATCACFRRYSRWSKIRKVKKITNFAILQILCFVNIIFEHSFI